MPMIPSARCRREHSPDPVRTRPRRHRRVGVLLVLGGVRVRPRVLRLGLPVRSHLAGGARSRDVVPAAPGRCERVARRPGCVRAAHVGAGLAAVRGDPELAAADRRHLGPRRTRAQPGPRPVPDGDRPRDLRDRLGDARRLRDDHHRRHVRRVRVPGRSARRSARPRRRPVRVHRGAREPTSPHRGHGAVDRRRHRRRERASFAARSVATRRTLEPADAVDVRPGGRGIGGGRCVARRRDRPTHPGRPGRTALRDAWPRGWRHDADQPAGRHPVAPDQPGQRRAVPRERRRGRVLAGHDAARVRRAPIPVASAQSRAGRRRLRIRRRPAHPPADAGPVARWSARARRRRSVPGEWVLGRRGARAQPQPRHDHVGRRGRTSRPAICSPWCRPLPNSMPTYSTGPRWRTPPIRSSPSSPTTCLPSSRSWPVPSPSTPRRRTSRRWPCRIGSATTSSTASKSSRATGRTRSRASSRSGSATANSSRRPSRRWREPSGSRRVSQSGSRRGYRTQRGGTACWARTPTPGPSSGSTGSAGSPSSRLPVAAHPGPRPTPGCPHNRTTPDSERAVPATVAATVAAIRSRRRHRPWWHRRPRSATGRRPRRSPRSATRSLSSPTARARSVASSTVTQRRPHPTRVVCRGR